jgi:hypothetical protein
MEEFGPPSEDEIIRHSLPGVLYSHDFGGGRFFQMLHHDDSGCEIKLAPKTMLKVVYLKEKDDIEGFEIIKLVSGAETQKVKLSKFNLQQVDAFLRFISSLDLKAITERRLRLADDEDLDATTVRRIKTILSKEGGGKVVLGLIEEGIITSIDIVNTAYRKGQLAVFKKMLEVPEDWRHYARENSIDETHEEKAWQHFFSKNDWIFGYGLDYRFNGILQKEFYSGEMQADGSGAVITDFLLADQNYTTFVEIKKPSTPMFAGGENRANAWKLSRDLFDSISQVLEQKASGLIRLSKGEVYSESGDRITQQAVDSKVVLVFGSWKRCKFASQNERRIKMRTFELYRRDSRNIKVLTFDELYRRAEFIVQHRERKEQKS